MVDSTDVVAGTNATATQYNNLRKDLFLGKQTIGAETDAATITIDLSTLAKGKIRTVTLGGNRTIAFSNPDAAGQSFILILKQDGTGNRTVTWPTVKWVNSITPTLSTGAAKYDIFAFIYDGTDYFGSVVGQNFG